jgi:hypothetical protein
MTKLNNIMLAGAEHPCAMFYFFEGIPLIVPVTHYVDSKSSEAAKCFTPLQCSAGRLRCSRRTGRSLGLRFCNHTTSNTRNESQAVKGRTHRRSRTPQVWRPLDWQGQAPEHVEWEGNIAQDKKNLSPQVWRPDVLAWPSPRACRGGGIDEASVQKKLMT